MTGQEEDRKPVVVPTHVNLKVASQEAGSEVFIRIRRNTPLKKLMNAYCDKVGVGYDTFVFMYDGTQIGRETTPEQLELADGDEIDAFLHVDGGADLAYRT